MPPPPQVNADSPTFRIFDLGVLPGTGASRAFGLNDEGAVVGFSSSSGGPVKAFFWLFEPMYGFSSSFTMMQLASDGAANDINNAGIAVGRKPNAGTTIAHRWELAGGDVDEFSLGTLSTGFGEASEAFAINDASPYVIVGDSDLQTAECGLRLSGFRYDTTNGMQLLGTVGQQYGAGALGVNNNSTALAVGQRLNTDECHRFVATVCQPGAGSLLDGHAWSGVSALSFLDVLEDTWEDLRHEANDVNDDGRVVGFGTVALDPDPGDTLCVRRATFWASPGAVPVVLNADVSGQQAQANAIANATASGQLRVVGENTQSARALYWERNGSTWTTTVLLNQVLYPGYWAELTTANDINEHGWIVGQARRDVDPTSGVILATRGYLLVPVEADCIGDLNGDCKVNGFDTALILGQWGSTCTTGCWLDVNNDGVINGLDNAIVLGSWSGDDLCSATCVSPLDGGGSGASSATTSTGWDIDAQVAQLFELGESDQAVWLLQLAGSSESQ